MGEFKVQVLDRLPPIEPGRLLALCPPASAPAWLDDSANGCGYLAWNPDRELCGVLTPRALPAATDGIVGPSSRWPLAQQDPARELEQAAAGEEWSGPEEAAQWGGWMGYFGWECGHAYLPFPWTKPAVQAAGSWPAWRFARYRFGLWYTPSETLVLGPTDAPATMSFRSSARLLIEQAPRADSASCLQSRPVLAAQQDGCDFQAAVRQLRDWIGQGELFQANLSHTLQGESGISARELYAAVRLQQPTRHSAYFEDRDGRALLSWSPECFMQQRGRTLLTRPIKGTAPRRAEQTWDRQAALALEASEKERAELTMIVDMARNDLGQIAVPGSVRVESAGEVEAFPTLFHRTATVRAELRPGLGLADWMASCFPPASVSGAPKVRALQAISELEQEPRGPYCGAFGCWLPGLDRADFSVLIRSATFQDRRLSLRVGAGIVWDSQPLAEWQETLLKARYMEHCNEPTPIRGC